MPSGSLQARHCDFSNKNNLTHLTGSIIPENLVRKLFWRRGRPSLEFQVVMMKGAYEEEIYILKMFFPEVTKPAFQEYHSSDNDYGELGEGGS